MCSESALSAPAQAAEGALAAQPRPWRICPDSQIGGSVLMSLVFVRHVLRGGDRIVPIRLCSGV